MSSAKFLIGISKRLRRKSRMMFVGVHRDHDLQSGRRTGEGVDVIPNNS